MQRGSLISTPQTLLAPGANGWQGCNSYHDTYTSVLSKCRFSIEYKHSVTQAIVEPGSDARNIVEGMQTSASDSSIVLSIMVHSLITNAYTISASKTNDIANSQSPDLGNADRSCTTRCLVCLIL